MIAKHSLVALDCEPPHEKLNRGDLGTVVHVYRDGRGYEVEFVDGGGQTVALVTVRADDVRPIDAGGLPPEDGSKPWMKYAGMIETGDPTASQKIDDVIHGKRAETSPGAA